METNERSKYCLGLREPLVSFTDLNRLTVPELLRLFGDVEEDDEGQPFILVEDRATIPNPGGDEDEDEMYADEA